MSQAEPGENSGNLWLFSNKRDCGHFEPCGFGEVGAGAAVAAGAEAASSLGEPTSGAPLELATGWRRPARKLESHIFE